MSITINLYKGEPFVPRNGQPIPTTLAVPEIDGVELHDYSAESNSPEVAINNAWTKLRALIRAEGIIDKRDVREGAIGR